MSEEADTTITRWHGLQARAGGSISVDRNRLPSKKKLNSLK
jgi:hypothetical protein